VGEGTGYRGGGGGRVQKGEVEGVVGQGGIQKMEVRRQKGKWGRQKGKWGGGRRVMWEEWEEAEGVGRMHDGKVRMPKGKMGGGRRVT
jgi:hypothetical protein